MNDSSQNNWQAITESIKSKLRTLGCDLVGIAPVADFPELERFEKWLQLGFEGEMDYLHRHLDKSLHPEAILPSVQSVLVCGMNYDTTRPRSIDQRDDAHGWISRYAWGDDYHGILEAVLVRAVEWLQVQFPDMEYRLYADTGPTRDRIWAKYAGLGWFGKNSNLVNLKSGSFFFIGEIFLSLPLKPDKPAAERCGSCTRCIESCPTGAIVEPGVIDSRKCISYLTIELRGFIPEKFRGPIGRQLFGCDICQDVCPWNRKNSKTQKRAFEPRAPFFNPGLTEFYRTVRDEFTNRFRKSAMKRTKQKGLLRNISVAMGNTGNPAFLPELGEMAVHQDPAVKAHAEWAIQKIETEEIR